MFPCSIAFSTYGEKYGQEHNIVFSTDPTPALSKTKCMFFCGRTGNVKYPDPVQLDGKDLPWVEHADHLGHTLHQSVTMEMDSNRARAKFIQKTVDVREQFSFAQPKQQLQMVEILCCDGYGSMLWELQSDKAEQFFKTWNTAGKLIWGVPRSTYTYTWSSEHVRSTKVLWTNEENLFDSDFCSFLFLGS